MVKSKYAMEAVAIVTVWKLLMYQTENFVIFIDEGVVGVTVKLSKWKWSNTIGNRKEAISKTVNSIKDL